MVCSEIVIRGTFVRRAGESGKAGRREGAGHSRIVLAEASLKL